MKRIILLCLVMLGILAQPSFGSNLGPIFGQSACCDHNEIEVSGSGSAFGQPDIARVSVRFEAEGKTSQEAVTALSEKVNTLILILQINGIDEKDYETSTISVFNNYAGGQVVGQKASQSITITLRNIDESGSKVGIFVDQIATVDTIQINSINFDIYDKSPLQVEARERAFKDAKQKAEDYADAAGIRVGRVVTIEDG